jgi:hypothetical protein
MNQTIVEITKNNLYHKELVKTIRRVAKAIFKIYRYKQTSVNTYNLRHLKHIIQNNITIYVKNEHIDNPVEESNNVRELPETVLIYVDNETGKKLACIQLSIWVSHFDINYIYLYDKIGVRHNFIYDFICLIVHEDVINNIQYCNFHEYNDHIINCCEAELMDRDNEKEIRWHDIVQMNDNDFNIDIILEIE